VQSDGSINPIAASTQAPQGSNVVTSPGQAPTTPLDDVLLAQYETADGTKLILVGVQDPNGKDLWISSYSGASGTLVPTGIPPLNVPNFVILGPSGLAASWLTANVSGKGKSLIIASATSGVVVVDPQALSLLVRAPYDDTPDQSGIAGACANPAPTRALAVAPLPSKTTVDRLGMDVQQDLYAVVPNGVVFLQYDDSSTPANLIVECYYDTTTNQSLMGGIAVASGDFDGDGLDDLAVSDGNAIDVYYGAAFPPGTPPP
jgi:hypothetical protein